MELKTTKEFVLKAHSEACDKLKKEIEKEFPEAFKAYWEKGRWYKLIWDNGNATAYVKSDGIIDSHNGGTKGIGIHNGGEWDCSYEGFWGGSPDVQKRLMTPKEIETMLWKEAEKRGIGKDTKIEECLHYGKDEFNHGNFTICYNTGCDEIDELWNINGCIYKQGKWATPIDPNKELKEQIEKMEKELQKLKARIK